MTTRRNRILLICAVLLPVLLLGTVRALFAPSGCETAEDAFWHVAAGRRPFGDMIARKFPLTLSAVSYTHLTLPTIQSV